MGRYLLSESKIRGYRKRMLSLWLQKGMFWIPGQRLVDQENTICRNVTISKYYFSKVDKVLSKFKIHGITKTNEMFYAGVFVVTNRLGVKIDNVAGRKNLIWKRRLQNKIKELRKDLSQLEASKDKGISNFRHWERFERKYNIRIKRQNVLIEELKQRITAIAAKVRRYQERVDSYRQNRLFENNQRQFYSELDQEEERCGNDQPLAEELKEFWGNI